MTWIGPDGTASLAGLAALAGMTATGFLSSGHCFGMCGGIAGALALRSRAAGAASAAAGARIRPWIAIAAHNAGRLTTYAALGAAAGAAGAALAAPFPQLPAARVARLLAALSFAGVALFLVGRPGWLAPLERAGGRLFRALEPLRRRLPAGPSTPGAYLAGLLWGFLPCGLVYSAAALAATSGSALAGALAMLAFGAGTLPAVVASGGASRLFARVARATAPRRLAAAAYLLAAAALAFAAVRSRGDGHAAAGGAPVCHTGLAAGALSAPVRPGGS